MKVSYNWLRDYVPTSLAPLPLGERFQLTSSVLDSLQDTAANLANVVVGEVVSVKPHPDAQKLRVAAVKVGAKKRTIVCGAPNLEEGQKVVVALPGALLHPVKGEPFEIQTATLRGVVSEGMLCGYDELGIDLPSDGIIVLPKDAKTGMPAAEALLMNDHVLDLEITPNRPDLLSYFGLAREAAAFDNRRLSEPPLATLETVGGRRAAAPHIQPFDSHLCHRYSAIQLGDVKVGPSPYWLQARLLLSGIRPVNNVVDVTNYVMLELGQPLHAFDANLLMKKGERLQVGVRSARAKEKIQLLDHTERTLAEGDILIVDGADKPLALAGIMGGEGSEVSAETTGILLESAVFPGAQIRRTSRRLGLRSEASGRFEKGLDPELTVTVLKRAIYLLKQVAGATVVGALADTYPRRPERSKIHVNYAWIQQVLGVSISPAECKAILQKLGFQLSSLTKSSFEAIPPSWRADISLPEDIVEELIRMWGYERLPMTMPSGSVFPPHRNERFEALRRLRRSFAAAGYAECVSQGLVSAASIGRCGITVDDKLRVRLPLSLEGEYLTPEHLVTFLQNISGPNLAYAELSLMEIGKVFTKKSETLRLSLIRRTGSESPETLYRNAKAVLEHSLGQIGRSIGYEPEGQAPAFFQEGSTLRLVSGGVRCGWIGLIDPQVTAAWKIRSAATILYATLDLDELLSRPARPMAYRPLSAYPATSRDLTLVVDESMPAGTIDAFFAEHAERTLLTGHRLSDAYRGAPLPEGTKSLTVSLAYQASDRTLSDAEVNADLARLSRLAEEKLKARIA